MDVRDVPTVDVIVTSTSEIYFFEFRRIFWKLKRSNEKLFQGGEIPDPAVNPIIYEGSIDCKTNVLFHECSG